MPEHKSPEEVFQQVQEKLDRIAAYLKTYIAGDGRLDEGDQYAVRVIESRKRFLDLLYKSAWGPEQERDETRDKLLVRDVGVLFMVGDVRHGKGNFSCRACDRVPSGNDFVNGARLCLSCRKGVQHLGTQRQSTGNPLVTSDDMPMIRPGVRYTPPNQLYTVTQTYVCDNCGQSDVYRQYTEEESAPIPEGEGKWLTLKLPGQ